MSIFASLVGGLFGMNAADDAADAQVNATRMATEESRRQYNQSRTDMAPWREAGVNALSQLQTLMSPEGGLMNPYSPENLQDDPGYQFGMAEGEKAINRNMKARGMYNSGAALKAINRFGQDYAGTKYNEAFNRDQVSKNAIYNMLAGQSGMGQSTASQVASMGMQNANQIGNYMLQGGNARAAGIVGGANSMIGALDDISSHQRMLQLLGGG